MPDTDLDIAWSAQLIRLSLFPGEVGALLHLDLQRLTGLDAETDERRPKERHRRQSAPFADGNVELHASTLRADLLYTPQLQLSGPPPELSAFVLPGAFEEKLGEFINLIEPSISTLDASIVRIAVGATLVVGKPNLAAIYDTLRRCLRSVTVSENMRDLLYRINWRVPSTIQGVRYLNRLTTWSESSAKLVGVGTSAPEQKLEKEYHLVQMELDLSTPSESIHNISPEIRNQVVTKLRELAEENARFGEVKPC